MDVAVVVAAAVVIAVVAVRLLSRRRADPVDSFRRQIDALSPEARRPTIAQASDDEDDHEDGDEPEGGASGT